MLDGPRGQTRTRLLRHSSREVSKAVSAVSVSYSLALEVGQRGACHPAHATAQAERGFGQHAMRVELHSQSSYALADVQQVTDIRTVHELYNVVSKRIAGVREPDVALVGKLEGVEMVEDEVEFPSGGDLLAEHPAP